MNANILTPIASLAITVTGLASQPPFSKANRLADSGNFPEAIAKYEHALLLGYRTPPLLSNLGVAYAREGNREKARMLFQEALRVDPGYPGARANLEKLENETGQR